MATLGELDVLIGADIAGFEEAINKVEGELKGFSSFASTAIAGAAAAVGASIVALGVESVKAAGDIQALEKGFAATYKGGEDLSVALAKVRDLAKLPGLGLKEALQGATNLQAAGFSADLATRALGAFGNALATVGKGKADLDGVGLALSQIASKGKISAEEINQLAERVPQIRQAMIAAFGSADTQVLQKAKISATDFVEGVTKELEKLPKVTGGINNAIENFSDASTIALAKLGTSLNNAFNIEGVINSTTDLLTKAGAGIESLEPVLKEAGDAFYTYFGPTGAGGQALAGLVDAAENAVVEISGAFSSLNKDSLGGMVTATGTLSQTFQILAVDASSALNVLGGSIGSIARLLQGDFSGAADEAKRAAFGLIDPLAALFGYTVKTEQGFDGAAGGGGRFGTSLLQLSGVLTGFDAQLQGFAGGLPQYGNALNSQSGLLVRLHEQLKQLKADQQNAGTEEAALAFNPLIDKLEAYIKRLEGGSTSTKKLEKDIKSLAESLMALRVPKELEDSLKTPDFQLKGLLGKAKDNEPEQLDLKAYYDSLFNGAASSVINNGGKIVEAFGTVNDGITKQLAQSQLAAEMFSEGLENVLVQGFTNIAAGFGEAIGQILSGASGLDSLPSIFLGALGGLAIQVGELAIATGIAVAGIKESLETLNPYVAIAGGIALVALGTYAKGAASNIGKGGAASSVGSSLSSIPSASASNAAGTASQPLVVRVVGTLSGRGADLVAIIREQDYRVERTT